jgi:hypothetical protein
VAKYRAITVPEVQQKIATTNGGFSEMECYEHAKANEPKDAVAVCSNCGAALCMEHLVEVVERAPETNEKKRRIYCQTCSENR